MPRPHDTSDAQALADALRAVLVPLAELAVARGLPFGQVEALLKQAFVDAARKQHGGPANRQVSRIATATGLTRREVTRMTQQAAATPPPAPRSHASELFARWMSDPRYRTRSGPRALPRLGPEPSFEALAQTVTRDVHPRSLLDELIRLRLAEHDEASDKVTLAAAAFVPRGDAGRMLGFLGDNVGDHLAGAVANVLGDGHRHFEQALFADGLPADAIARLRADIAEQWRALRAALVPKLQALVDEQRAVGTDGGRRVRIGLYSFDDGDAGTAAAPQLAARPRRIRTRER